MNEYGDMSTAETLAPALLRQRFGATWYARWQRLADEAAQWLAIALTEELAIQPALAPAEALAALARRPDARRVLTGRNVDALLAQLMATGLLPGTH
jgi:hypothetical protein